VEVPRGYEPLTQSRRLPARGARLVGPADPGEQLTVSIRVRRSPGAPELPTPGGRGGRRPLSRSEFAEQYGAAPADLEKVEAFARNAGLSVVESSKARRTVTVAGTVEQLSRAFAVDLAYYESDQERYRGREGHVHLPADLVEVVEGVFGLDNRRMAQALLMQAATPDLAITALTPPQVAALYNFPPGSAAGQTIGLLEFGGGYRVADIQAFFTGLGLTTPGLTDVGVDGQTNSPGIDGNEDAEVALDIDVAGSVAPGADVAVYFAPWTEQGWIDALTTAVHDSVNEPCVLSISWGWPELETIDGLTWTQQAVDAVDIAFQEAAALGVTVFVASGDFGTDCGIGDGQAHVLYPAADPYVTACGGTSIENVAGAAFTEATWNDNGVTGGGISDLFPLPGFQSQAGIPGSVNDNHAGRGVPDVAGNADPASGYMLILNGASVGPIGGTSATAPLYAGLVALLDATLGEPVGYLNPELYGPSGPSIFRDIDDLGSNATGSAPGYTAGPGWDACTGWGSIDGSALLAALRPVTGHLWHTLRRPDGTWTGLGDVNAQFAIPGPVHTVGGAWDAMTGETQFMFATADGHLWHSLRRPDGSWTGLGDVNAQFAIPGPVRAVAATGDGELAETQFMFTTANGHLWHTLRRPDGTWTGLGDVTAQLAIPGHVNAVAATGDGEVGEAQFMFTTMNGHLWHTLRRPDGSWTGLGDVNGQFAIPGKVRAVAACGDWIDGEAQFMFATADGHLWHTIRRADGSWTGLGDVNAQFAIPGPVRAVAAAGDGVPGQAQFMFTTADGHLWHTIRRPDGSWSGLGDVNAQFAIPGHVHVVTGTGDGELAEAQFMFAT
jgi:kumamolisin